MGSRIAHYFLASCRTSTAPLAGSWARHHLTRNSLMKIVIRSAPYRINNSCETFVTRCLDWTVEVSVVVVDRQAQCY